MAKFSTITKGARARETVELTLIDGTVWRVDVSPLIGEQEADVEKGARSYAKANGLENPKAGDPLYELGLYVHTLRLTCLDADEREKRMPAFDSIEQILDRDTGLDRDRIVFLYEAQQSFQDACSFRRRGLSMSEYIQAVVAHGTAPEDAEELPFERWAPSTRRSFARTMASQVLVSFSTPKSPGGPGSPDEKTSLNGSTPPSPEPGAEPAGTPA